MKEKAAECVEGILPTEENYDEAVKILKNRFGSDRVMKQSLYSQLESIPRSNMYVPNLQSTFDSVEKVLRQLESVNEDPDQPSLIRIVLRKFPQDILTKLEESRNSESDWTMQELRELLNTIIAIKVRARSEFLSEESEEKQKGSQGEKANNRKGQKPKEQKYVNAFVEGSQGRNVKMCIFCSADHYHDKCEKYKTAASRFARLQTLKVCFLCFKSNHFANSCSLANHLKPCFYCKSTMHNRALCPVQFGNGSNNGGQAQAQQKRQGGPKSSKKRVSQNSMAEESKPNLEQEEKGGRSTEAKKPEQGEKKTVHGDAAAVGQVTKAMLMTATVVIVNPNDSAKKCQVRAFLDSEAEKSFVSARIAAKLDLEPNFEESLSVMAFGSDKPKEVATANVSIKLMLQSGGFQMVNAYSVQHLTGQIQRESLTAEDVSFMEQYPESYFADKVPKEMDSFKPELLLGLDCFWYLVNMEGRQQLPSGLHLVPSKLGLLIGGAPITAEENNRYTNVHFKTAVNSSVAVLSMYHGEPDPPLKTAQTFKTTGVWNNWETATVQMSTTTMSHFRNSRRTWCSRMADITWHGPGIQTILRFRKTEPWHSTASEIPSKE